MTKFQGFRCLSCDTLQTESILEPISQSLYLSGSVCHHCGQVIPTETKSAQLAAYLKSRIYAEAHSDSEDDYTSSDKIDLEENHDL